MKSAPSAAPSATPTHLMYEPKLASVAAVIADATRASMLSYPLAGQQWHNHRQRGRAGAGRVRYASHGQRAFGQADGGQAAQGALSATRLAAPLRRRARAVCDADGAQAPGGFAAFGQWVVNW